MTLIADLILIIHVLYVGIVIGSVPLIVIGGMRNWRWVRNRLFRFTHLTMIVTVVLEALLGLHCPLTVWERAARGTLGTESDGFIAQGFHHILFYRAPPWLFTTLYVAFAALVLALFFIVPMKHSGASDDKPRSHL